MNQPEHFTLESWLQHWIGRYASLRCSQLTIERSTSFLAYLHRSDELARLGRTALAKVRFQQLESAVLSLVDAPALRRTRLSIRSIRHFAALLRVALDKAARLDMIPSNPMMKVDLPINRARRDIRALTADQIDALRWQCRGDWTFPIVELALATGCRRGELLALEWDDVRWTQGVLHVTKSVEHSRTNGLTIKAPKNGKARVCTLPRVALEALRRHAADSRGGKLIFSHDGAALMNPALVSQTVVRRMRGAGINPGSMHTLRHTHASTLLSRGVPLSSISTRLGHADVEVTARIYCHALPPDDQRAAEEWDRLIEDRCSLIAAGSLLTIPTAASHPYAYASGL